MLAATARHHRLVTRFEGLKFVGQVGQFTRTGEQIVQSAGYYYSDRQCENPSNMNTVQRPAFSSPELQAALEAARESLEGADEARN
jgi:hypothetical protein